MKSYTRTKKFEAAAVAWVAGAAVSLKEPDKGQTVPDAKDQIILPAQIVNNYAVSVGDMIMYRDGKIEKVMSPAAFEAYIDTNKSSKPAKK